MIKRHWKTQPKVVPIAAPRTPKGYRQYSQRHLDLMRLARKKIGLRTDEVTMIGDTMETDIRGATDLGFRSVLVLSGSTRREDLRNYPFAPTMVVEASRLHESN